MVPWLSKLPVRVLATLLALTWMVPVLTKVEPLATARLLA